MNKLSTIAITAVAGINALKIKEDQLSLAQVDAEATISFAYTIKQADSASANISNGPDYVGPNHALPSQMSYLGGSETWDWGRHSSTIHWRDYFGVNHLVYVQPGKTITVSFPVNGRDWYWWTSGNNRERTGFGSDC